MTVPDDTPTAAASTLTAAGGLRLQALGDEEGCAELFAALAGDKITATATIAGLIIIVDLLAEDHEVDMVDWTSKLINRLVEGG